MAWHMAKDCPILNSKMTRSITKLQACHGYWISLVCYVLLISSYSFLAPHTVICAPRPLAVCTESITACDRSCRRMLSLVSTVHAAIMWCHLSCVFFVVWVRLLLCCLRHGLCNAYAATVGAYAAHPFEGVPTQAQRPHKATPQCMFLPTPSHFCLLLEGWKRNFCLRDHSPIHIFAARAPRLQSAHRHLAATPMQQPHQQPGPKAHTKHLVDKS